MGRSQEVKKLEETQERLARRFRLVLRMINGDERGITRAQRRSIPERPEEWRGYLIEIFRRIAQIDRRLSEEEEDEEEDTEEDERWKEGHTESREAQDREEVVPMEQDDEGDIRSETWGTESSRSSTRDGDEDGGEEEPFDLWRGCDGDIPSRPIVIST